MTLAGRAGAWLLLAASVGGAAPPQADDAQRAYRAGRFEDARRLWAPRAEAGDAQAQLGLGVLHDVGQGVPRNPAVAYRWYRRAAEAGLAEALGGAETTVHVEPLGHPTRTGPMTV